MLHTHRTCLTQDQHMQVFLQWTGWPCVVHACEANPQGGANVEDGSELVCILKACTHIKSAQFFPSHSLVIYPQQDWTPKAILWRLRQFLPYKEKRSPAWFPVGGFWFHSLFLIHTVSISLPSSFHVSNTSPEPVSQTKSLFWLVCNLNCNPHSHSFDRRRNASLSLNSI